MKNMAKKSLFDLGIDQKGFICTSNNRERECVREAYNVLNEYADILYPKEAKNEEIKSEDPSKEGDIEDELKNEVATLKDESAGKALKQFQVVESKVKGCVFIRTTVESPFALTEAIVKDLEETHKQKTTHLMRMLPIEATCKPYPEDILKTVEPLIEKFLPEAQTFSVLFKVRNNSTSRDEVIPRVAKLVTEKLPKIKADLDDPEFSIIIEVLCKVCCIGIVKNYFKRAKYNLVQLAQKKEKE
nr:EOG090X0GPG [Eulimnadia texana]